MILHMLLLVCALSVDIFAACIVYGTNQVMVSGKQTAVLNAVCSLCLGVSLSFGNLLDSYIPEVFTKKICIGSLLLLGSLKLADSSIRKLIKRHKEIQKRINFSFSSLHFIINIYSDPMEADADLNHTLSWKELILFSLAMSIDGLISGSMAAFLKISVPLTVLLCFVMGEMFSCLGLFLGRKIGRRCSADFSWVGGILFIVLAVLKR